MVQNDRNLSELVDVIMNAAAKSNSISDIFNGIMSEFNALCGNFQPT